MTTVPVASVRDSLRALAVVLLPVVARGPVVRRPWAVAAAQRVDADRLAVQELVRLRSAYGRGPLLLRLPRRAVALVLDPEDAARVLAGAPEPFSPANREKRAALRRFQPEGLLISSAVDRAVRRPFNEAVLQPGREHQNGERVREIVRTELGALRPGVLTWEAVSTAWWLAVRTVVLGSGAREDTQVTDLLLALRRSANWSFAGLPHRALRTAFLERVAGHVDRAEPGSLAELVARTPGLSRDVAVQQVPHWLFAFDAGAWTLMRALALATSTPGERDRVRSSRTRAVACVHEALRLWPTTPLLLRDTTAITTWPTGELPAGTAVVVHAPLLHRDPTRVAEADTYSPGLVLDPQVSFSAGPAVCPGRDLVLLVTSEALRTLLEQDLRLLGDPLVAPLPGTLSPFRLRFARASA